MSFAVAVSPEGKERVKGKASRIQSSRVCVVIPFILGVRFVDVPAGLTQEEGHSGFLHLPPAVVALIFLARRVQPFLSLVDREVEFCVLTTSSFIVTISSFSTYGALFFSSFFSFFFCEENPRSGDETKIRTHISTSEGLEVTN